MELHDLMDRGLTLKEKYGPERGWKLSLRFDENRKDEPLILRESIGFTGLQTKSIDDRWKPVELIRKNYNDAYCSPRQVEPGETLLKYFASDRRQTLIHETGQDAMNKS